MTCDKKRRQADSTKARRLRALVARGIGLKPAHQEWLAAYERRPSVSKRRHGVAVARRASDTVEIVAAALRVPRASLVGTNESKAAGWPRAVLAWALTQTGYTQVAAGKICGVPYQTIRSRMKRVEAERRASGKVRAQTDALVARRPTVTLTIEVGSPLWCLFDQIDMELDATWHALNFRAVADQGANG